MGFKPTRVKKIGFGPFIKKKYHLQYENPVYLRMTSFWFLSM
jgi:hypothetical protein